MFSHSESLIPRLSHFFEGAFQTFARRGLTFLKDDSTGSPGMVDMQQSDSPLGSDVGVARSPVRNLGSVCGRGA
jgi:hypothetical protein